jgi:molybdopterin synthase sulfur carrier subunit
MQIRVRYFAALRESLGAEEWVTLVAGAATVAALRDALIARSPAHARALSRQRAVRCAVDQRMADDVTPLHPGVEVAFFPPVTGG